MDSMADILADTRRYLAEAIRTLDSVKAGAKLAPGMTREEAIQTLGEAIALYEKTLRQYGGEE
jgi:hypothetical protein